MLSTMGRPRQHGDGTAAALLDAAERTVQQHGLDGLSVRGVAAEVGTTTRAVYSLFGSKDGLVAALGAHCFEILRASLEDLPTTDDPVADLVEAGLMFRRFAIDHPSLFAIGVQRRLPRPGLWAQSSEASRIRALVVLEQRVSRLSQAGLLGGRPVHNAVLQFHALCEGLAAVELRGACSPAVVDQMWREGMGALVAGFAIAVAPAALRSVGRRSRGAQGGRGTRP
jgi:AcrR family transcriptional regulator